jgi:hypothetical protein
MELPRLYDELTLAAEKAGISVRTEPFDKAVPEKQGGRGGLCRLKGEWLLLVDARAPLVDRIVALASALAEVDLEDIYMPPVVRATIGAYAAKPRLIGVPDAERRPLVRTVRTRGG